MFETQVNQILQDLNLSLPLTKPKDSQFGDFALPTFAYAKEKGINPAQAATEIAQKITDAKQDLIVDAVAVGPYVNITLNKTLYTKEVIQTILTQREEYGSQVPMVHYHYVLDYSAPNIAKPFGIGHLRSTVIGGSVKKILEFCGHHVIGLNYIGDWGTQFGKVICAYKRWGNEDKLKTESVGHLLDLYVRFHEEAKENPQLEEEARAIFAELENGNAEYLAYWKQFRELSLGEFERIYEMMNVTFEEVRGEAYYNDKMQPVLAELKEKNLLTLSEGAQIVDFSAHNIKLPPVIIIKSNGASTYILRDIASALDRLDSFGADYLLYEVGQEQKLHFEQLKAILKLMGKEIAERIVHIDHGLYRFGDQKMSTRKGNIILMEDVLTESINRVRTIITEKNPELAASEKFSEISRQVGVGAVMFFDLMSDRIKDVAFTWERVLDFTGESGPYVQYTHARICSVLRKYARRLPEDKKYDLISTPSERKLIVLLDQFGSIVDQCAKTYKPHTLTRYLLDLAQAFNEYYQKEHILTDDADLTGARIMLLVSVRQVLANGLGLLGIDAPQQM